MVLVSILKKNTNPKTTKIAASDAGITLVNFGKPQMISMVKNTNANSTYMVFPVNQFPLSSLNWTSCDMNMIMAKPFTNPKITGCGTRRISFPNLRIPAANWITPARITVAKMYSMPCDFTSVTNTTATAPVAPEIIPGRPPKMEVTIPIMNAAYNPVNGDSPAMSAKAIASGTKANATVNPERISVL